MDKCHDCKALLTATEKRDFGNYCNACIIKHQTSCRRRDCSACKRSKCWQCSGVLEKITVDLSVDKNHPYPDWYWRCRECGEFQVKCKQCRTTAVDFWHDGSEVWDDICICESCGAPFCPCCNQGEVGCILVEDEDFYCDGCAPKTAPLPDRSSMPTWTLRFPVPHDEMPQGAYGGTDTDFPAHKSNVEVSCSVQRLADFLFALRPEGCWSVKAVDTYAFDVFSAPPSILKAHVRFGADPVNYFSAEELATVLTTGLQLKIDEEDDDDGCASTDFYEEMIRAHGGGETIQSLKEKLQSGW